MSVLRKYIHKIGTIPVEQAVSSESIPQLITIQKGILALTRQWKNILYMPHLAHMSFKTRKQRPYTVSFAVPETVGPAEDEDDDDDDDEPAVRYNVVDERVSIAEEDDGLLKGDSEYSLSHPRHSSPQPRYGDAAQDTNQHAGVSRTSSLSGFQKNKPQKSAVSGGKRTNRVKIRCIC